MCWSCLLFLRPELWDRFFAGCFGRQLIDPFCIFLSHNSVRSFGTEFCRPSRVVRSLAGAGDSFPKVTCVATYCVRCRLCLELSLSAQASFAGYSLCRCLLRQALSVCAGLLAPKRAIPCATSLRRARSAPAISLSVPVQLPSLLSLPLQPRRLGEAASQ